MKHFCHKSLVGKYILKAGTSELDYPSRNTLVVVTIIDVRSSGFIFLLGMHSYTFSNSTPIIHGIAAEILFIPHGYSKTMCH